LGVIKETPMRERLGRGFTLIEILVVVTLVGALLVVAIPYFRNSSSKQSVRAAMSAIASMHARTKAAAVQRGRSASLVLDQSAGTAVITTTTVAGVADTIGEVEDIAQRFGVSFTTTQSPLTFSPRGIGTNSAGTTIIISKSGFADTISVSAAGRLLQ
jgi:prepilin-type N-terminal cleavage/methylation domain-containing protein